MFDGFLVGLWIEYLFLYKEIFELLVYGWCLFNLDWWIDYIFFEFKELKCFFNLINEDFIWKVIDLVLIVL